MMSKKDVFNNKFKMMGTVETKLKLFEFFKISFKRFTER